MADNHERWWQGARGEWLVVVQVALIALVFFGPRTLADRALPMFPFPRACGTLGLVLMIAGTGFLIAGIIRLGPGLTPLPYPKDGATLIDTGPYALVRHPMYFGGMVLALGWALYVGSWLTVGYAVVLFVFLDLKSRREERWLADRFPGYRTYQRRVRRLIPLLY
ncbi:MAG TPA: isoprenylcysteine carboxylmethyltransferase family protein [Vicinamibacterales bacterium]|jgi:protein-S-isoprenylcysteine O-methyltransferase Ste14